MLTCGDYVHESCELANFSLKVGAFNGVMLRPDVNIVYDPTNIQTLI